MDTPGMDFETLTGSKSQARVDEEQLSLLTILHYVLGGLTALFASFFIFHIYLGLSIAHHPNAFSPPVSPPPAASNASGQPYPYSYGAPPPFFPPEMGYMFAAMGTIFVLGGWILGALTVYAGKCIKMRRNYVFILVIAGINCAFVMPLGTALGVFAFIVLLRPTVKAMFPQ